MVRQPLYNSCLRGSFRSLMVLFLKIRRLDKATRQTLLQSLLFTFFFCFSNLKENNLKLFKKEIFVYWLLTTEETTPFYIKKDIKETDYFVICLKLFLWFELMKTIPTILPIIWEETTKDIMMSSNVPCQINMKNERT